jgi:hypothetical protein
MNITRHTPLAAVLILALGEGCPENPPPGDKFTSVANFTGNSIDPPVPICAGPTFLFDKNNPKSDDKLIARGAHVSELSDRFGVLDPGNSKQHFHNDVPRGTSLTVAAIDKDGFIKSSSRRNRPLQNGNNRLFVTGGETTGLNLSTGFQGPNSPPAP